jgi:hypothetical protein
VVGTGGYDEPHLGRVGGGEFLGDRQGHGAVGVAVEDQRRHGERVVVTRMIDILPTDVVAHVGDERGRRGEGAQFVCGH